MLCRLAFLRCCAPFWRFVGIGVVGMSLSGSPARAGTWDAPPGWFERSPTTETARGLQAPADRGAWEDVVPALRKGAIQAYLRDQVDVAGEWARVARWSATLALPERDFVNGWIRAINAAEVGHALMPREYPRSDTPLAGYVSPAFNTWVLANPAFLESLFAQLSPCDYLPRSLTILDELYRADPRMFEVYAQLALAIALVYDVPPPPDWPHGQVSASALPRRWPAAAETFAFFVQSDRSGRTLHRLSALSVTELKFVVDVAVPFTELRWAQQNVTFPLDQLPKSYEAVKYRHDRWKVNAVIWPGPTYDLPTILSQGGICVDQAYFATQAGKARGVPTLFFRGAGLDGRHAWFGYLDGSRRWQMDAGRFAEQRFVTGVVHDPQTWADLSDHELAFLADGTRDTLLAKRARIHEVFARQFLEDGRPDVAVTSARKAINADARLVAAWDTLIEALAETGTTPKQIEGTLREAAVAFQRYPDLNGRYLKRVAESLRARGETSAADQEERIFARKNQYQRSDLTLGQLAEELARSSRRDPLTEQLRVYNAALEQYGRGEGITFFDKLVRPFVRHLVQTGATADARRALDRARAILRVEPDSQLDREMTVLANGIGR